MEQPSLDMQMYANVMVIKSQQEDIKDSVKGLEEAVDRHLLDASRLDAVESELRELREGRRDWVTWAMQTIGSIIITTLVVWIGGRLGVSVSW